MVSHYAALNTNDKDPNELPLPTYLIDGADNHFTTAHSHNLDPHKARPDRALAWVTGDELMGTVMKTSSQPLPTYSGLNCPVAIISTVFTYTPAHIEEACLGAFNINVCGYPKLWWAVPGTPQFPSGLTYVNFACGTVNPSR